MMMIVIIHQGPHLSLFSLLSRSISCVSLANSQRESCQSLPVRVSPSLAQSQSSGPRTHSSHSIYIPFARESEKGPHVLVSSPPRTLSQPHEMFHVRWTKWRTERMQCVASLFHFPFHLIQHSLSDNAKGSLCNLILFQ